MEKQTLDSGIIVLKYTGNFSLEDWRAYKQVVVDILDASDELVYILSDFSEIKSFAKEIGVEVGTAPHLTHPKLGIIVLLGGTALQNFMLQITDTRARRDDRGTKLRVHSDYERAMDTLLHFKEIHKITPPLS